MEQVRHRVHIRLIADPDKLRKASKCHKKAKGIQKYYVKKRLHHNRFHDFPRNVTRSIKAKFRAFRSINHVINTAEMNKLCLCTFDEKRYILDDGVHTLAGGHCCLEK